MFGLLLRADQETAKRAIISRGYDIEEEIRERRKEGETPAGESEKDRFGFGSYVKSIRCPLGVEGPHHAPHAKLPSFPSLLQ